MLIQLCTVLMKHINVLWLIQLLGDFQMPAAKDESYMVEDSSGRVWIRMGKEISVAIPEANGKYSIDKTPFLPIADRTLAQIYPDANGIVWFCTTDGLVRYDENLKKNYGESFKTLLRHITAGQETLNVSLADNAGNGVNIPYKNNTLRFEYAAPFFEQEEKTKYETWLEGFENGWSGWDNNSYKEYTNLPAGNYIFHVRAKNIYGKISEEANYYYTISPPWSATWWAYLLYFLGAIFPDLSDHPVPYSKTSQGKGRTGEESARTYTRGSGTGGRTDYSKPDQPGIGIATESGRSD